MSINTLLIANRGEIACRIIETARAMGMRTVAVYSDADADARHVELADVAVRIGGAEAADSYLRGDRIIMAALETDADAIHPGYGFLSENPDFVSAVTMAGLIFVGPSADAIRAMGLKDAAKALMEKAGVPVVPGYHGADQNVDILAAKAREIGYPVMIKAVAGGGGKGMRIVPDGSAFEAALTSARSEARSAFGNDAVLIEKYIEAPRHIEIQIFGDGTKAVHLFERDCSLQRRHQKVIEEAPAPGMTPEMRDAMGAAAVRAAEAVGYAGAGTVEFIVDARDGLRQDRFWFMEMNTRLQVEHPVTEAITGVDLVEWQLLVAAGGALPLAQSELKITGHAVEARLYAEDPSAGFLPATGRLEHLIFDDRVRIDTGVRKGDVISTYYDPMIAKLTAHGEDREAAIGGLCRALESTEIAGVTTNIAFLDRLLQNPDFNAGVFDTGLIDRNAAQLCEVSALSDEAIALAAVEALGLGRHPLQGFALWAPLRRHLTLDGRAVVVTPTGEGALVDVEGTTFRLAMHAERWRVDGMRSRLNVSRFGDVLHVFGAGGGQVALLDPLDVAGAADARGAIEAPMPGRLLSLAVSAGETVEKGQLLAVLEAMKMEHALLASHDGVVSEVLARTGDQVEAGATLIRFEDPET